MKILVVATKAPWPPVDGGRLLLLNTLEALAAAGCRVTLVAPVDASARFDLDRVARELSPWCEPVLVPAAPLPPVAGAAAVRGSAAVDRPPFAGRPSGGRWSAGWRRALRRGPRRAAPGAAAGGAGLRPGDSRGAARPERGERSLGGRGPSGEGSAGMPAAAGGEAAGGLGGAGGPAGGRDPGADGEDAARLGELAALAAEPGGSEWSGRPFPACLPARGGWPAIRPWSVFGSRGWLPNEDSAAWFLRDVWPAVRAELAGAVLHLYGVDVPSPPAGVAVHPPPGDSAEAFPAGSILAVPAANRVRGADQDPRSLGAGRSGGGDPGGARRAGSGGWQGGAGGSGAPRVRRGDPPAPRGARARRRARGCGPPGAAGAARPRRDRAAADRGVREGPDLAARG